MAINSYPDNSGGEVNFPEQLIDPVSKFRVSNPENLIDTDFEYGLQPTKWETVELINNTPSFFSKSGDTTIDGISSIITNAGTREIIVKTELDHGLAVGIPINVTGTKSITADGAYIINSIPDTKTFTYLCKDNQSDTNSILDLYSSIITGEFFQGSQLRISDSDGIVTDAEGTSTLTVTTNTTHGFGKNTPFYFLNLNSTVAQEFQAANTAARSFDASNSATAQTFDGSNSLSSVNIDWSNSATFGGTPSTVSATNTTADTITVTHQTAENFSGRPIGTPLYYNVSATSGYFNENPRGVVFLKPLTGETSQLGTSTSTFQISLVPNGNAIDLTTSLSGTFQIANQARTFAGNNINPLTQTVINVEVGPGYVFDGGNQGYTGAVQPTNPPNNTLTVISSTGTTINASGASSVDAYVGAMVLYSTTGAAATGLTTNTTYFIRSFTNNGAGNYDFSVSALPGGTAISVSGGTGTQTFSRIGVSLDKDIVHIPNSNFAKDDMIEYSFPVAGSFGTATPEQQKIFYFVKTAYDSHNYALSEELGFKPVVATGGNFITETYANGRVYRVHNFTSVGTSSFVVSDAGLESQVEYLLVAGGGGGGGGRHGAGGGAGGMIEGTASVTAQTYSVVVGAGGAGGLTTGGGLGSNGANSSFAGVVAIGGGRGGSAGTGAGATGGSGGGASRSDTSAAGTAGQGFAGGLGNAALNGQGAGGGGASQAGGPAVDGQPGGKGGDGRLSYITGINTRYAGGGGGGGAPYRANGGPGLGGLGGGGNGNNFSTPGQSGQPNTGGGGGGQGGDVVAPNEAGAVGGSGGSGIAVIRYPTTPPPTGEYIIASGGETSITTVGGIRYAVHQFKQTGNNTFTVSGLSSKSLNTMTYLIVAGGGGGGGSTGGGGGAGGVRTGSVTASAQSYTIVVGDGGNGSSNQTGNGTNGGNSSAFGITATGGGKGAGTTGGSVVFASTSGGSGGGGAAYGSVSAPGSAGTSGQGFAGGSMAGPGDFVHPGGGGAGGPGSNGGPGGNGAGGIGIQNNITGTLVYYAGGGGGSIGGVGGLGGGGSNPGGGSGGNGFPNTGGGGAGGWAYSTDSNPTGGGRGGSGIVIVRYQIGEVA